MPTSRHRLVACAATVLACLPYLALKVGWLAGSSVGFASGPASADMHGERYVVGNVLTLGMDLVAVGLVLALALPWGRRLPGWLLAAPVWVAAGLLAPVALGVPLGLLVQAVVGGAPAPADNGLEGWVYATVYGGFVAQAVGILAAFWWHARDRWPERLVARRVPARSGVVVAAAVASGFGVLHLVWAVAGTGAGGPDGFETATQRTYLAATGLVVLAGAAAVAAAGRLGRAASAPPCRRSPGSAPPPPCSPGPRRCCWPTTARSAPCWRWRAPSAPLPGWCWRAPGGARRVPSSPARVGAWRR